ncbi:MAG: hypothetical protein HOV94_13115 [Saccharothrix sp.]|nr:hypothetical protein [Saccharothrix sp.]
MDDVLDTGYHHPRTPVELWLARQWEEVIGFAVGIRENFFEVGGNSLDAARVINAVYEEFGVQLPLNVLTDHPTVERLAARLRELNDRLPGPLVALQRGDGTRPPLFLVHPANGQVGAYCHLAQALGEEFTVFGLQAAGLHSDAEPAGSVAAAARAYVDAVRSVAPEGPYHLGGCSTGAAIAHEMAAELADAGAEVRLLAVIDPGLPVAVSEPGFADAGPEDDPTAVLADWKARGLVPPDETTDFVTRARRVWQAGHDALRDWRPRPYRGPLDIVRGPNGGPTDWAAGSAHGPAGNPNGDPADWAAGSVREHTTADVAGVLRGLVG